MTVVPCVEIPPDGPYWLTNVRLPLSLLDETVTYREAIAALAAPPFAEELVAADVAIDQGRIQAIAPVGTASPDHPPVDGHQGLVWPCFVDMHTHLDKGHSWNRNPNPTGTFRGALEAVFKDAAQHWTAEDLYRRMDFGLRCSYAHGTKALRTHFDAFGPMAATALAVIGRLQQEWAGRLEIQAVCLVSGDYYLTPEAETLADQVAGAGAILGGVLYPNPDLHAQIDRVFELARDRQLNLDLHTDESLDPEEMSLRYVAETKLRHDFAGEVVCGHCCTLSVQAPEVMAETLRLVKAAAIAIVSLPMCNLYLQDRQPHRTPRYRGPTVIHELAQQGIPVAIASDNCRDPFYAYGDHDGLEVFTQAVRIGQLDRPIGAWVRTLTQTPADLMGLPHAGRLGLGQPADLVIFKARTFNELLSRPQSDRVVVRQGRAIDPTLPDYAELDDVVGLA